MTENEQLLEKLIENCTADSAKAFFRRKNVHFKAQNEPLENSDPEKFSNLWKIGRLDFEADNVVFAFPPDPYHRGKTARPTICREGSQ
jgi:hypothetical protein